MPKLSILIPTTISRTDFHSRLLNEIEFQRRRLANYDDIEVIMNIDNGEKSTGRKRNELIAQAKGDYVVGVDSDDQITDVYLKKLLDVCDSSADCGELRGLYFLNGKYDRPFIHSIKYTHWWQDANGYYRNPNHISCLRRELILDIPFPDIYVGEDGKFSEALFASGRMKKEYSMSETLYLYYDRTKINGV